jgi:hypothetical protein
MPSFPIALFALLASAAATTNFVRREPRANIEISGDGHAITQHSDAGDVSETTSADRHGLPQAEEEEHHEVAAKSASLILCSSMGQNKCGVSAPWACMARVGTSSVYYCCTVQGCRYTGPKGSCIKTDSGLVLPAANGPCLPSGHSWSVYSARNR